MQDQDQSLQTLKDIKQLMANSSRFISLSGWSGVAAGTCALIGAWLAHQKIDTYQEQSATDAVQRASVVQELLLIAALTFVAAFVLAFLFTYLRSRKAGIPVWGYTARRVMWNVAVPMAVGGLLIWRLVDLRIYELIAPTCLLFYGLGLVNASKYTLPEIRYLGYFQLLLGSISLWLTGYGLYFWAIGFGVLHILYGILMWNRYERHQ